MADEPAASPLVDCRQLRSDDLPKKDPIKFSQDTVRCHLGISKPHFSFEECFMTVVACFDRVMWPNVDADIPQRTRIAEKHQEWGHNSQKGATCRRHNELFVSKRFKATDVHGGRGDSCHEVKAKCPPKFTKSTLKKDDQTNFPKKVSTQVYQINAEER
ncbi:peptidyl-prolyl cis-trans isomerase FKBP3-like isoform X2 [Stigmatopora argus]